MTGSTAELPPDTVAHDRTPDPFVLRTWPFVPSAAGNVHTRFDVIVAGALNPT